MSYNKKIWSTGEIIQQGALNNIEEGIYALDQAINSPTNGLSEKLDQMVQVSDSQPASANNKIWVKGNGSGIQIPAYGEFEDLCDSIADEYSTSSAYAVGDLVIHENKVYKCTTAISPSGESWDSSHWSETTIDTQLAEMKGDVTDLKNSIYTHKSVTWEQGAIASATGVLTNNSSTTRIRTKYIIPNSVYKISVDSGYKCIVAAYSDVTVASYVGMYNGTSYVKEAAWLTGDIVLSGNYYFKLVLAMANDASIAASSGVHVTMTAVSDALHGIDSLPVLELTGDISGMTKENAVTLNYSIFGLTGELTCKWQGSSSLRYAKKNYTLKFDNELDAWKQWCTWVNAFRAANGIASRVTVPEQSRWGLQKKFCMKANWIDPSMARNIVCARLWGQIVKNRVDSNAIVDGRADAPNYGAIDGFPVEIRINGESNGLYTFNIPKDKWAFAMDDNDTNYIVGGENNANNACCWKSDMGVSDWDAVEEYDPTASYSIGDYVYYDDTLYKCNTAIGAGGETWTDSHWTSYFAIEYVSGENKSNKDALSSLNEVIQLIVSAGAGWDTDPNITDRLDVDSVFDYFIFACCLNCHDGMARNILYGSYGGTQWFMSAYDLDTTFGSDAYSTAWYNVKNDRNQFTEAATMNRLAYLILTYSPAKLKARYQELRAGILSDENVWHELSQFIVDIPSRDYAIDRNIWPTMPGTATATLSQYMDYYRMHCKYLDDEIDALT